MENADAKLSVCIYIDARTLAHNRTKPPHEHERPIILRHAEWPAFRLFDVEFTGPVKLVYDKEAAAQRRQPMLWIEAAEENVKLPDGYDFETGWRRHPWKGV